VGEKVAWCRVFAARCISPHAAVEMRTRAHLLQTGDEAAAVAARLLHGTADSPCSVSMDAQPFKQCASGGQRLANHSGVASLGSSQLYSLLSSLALARAALFSVMPSASRYTEKVEEARGEGEKERGREGERERGREEGGWEQRE